MTRALRVLLVEDNRDLAEEVLFHLRHEGFFTQCAHSAAEMNDCIVDRQWDVLVLDLGLPDGDGLAIANDLAGRQDLRIVMLTARAGREDRIAGFTSGADVYLTKPVDLDELSAVIRRTASRLPPEQAAHILDSQKQCLLIHGTRYQALTTLECRLVQYLMKADHFTATRTELEAHLWGNVPTLSTAKRLDILVHRLRQKLATRLPEGTETITTRWGQGYTLALPVAVAAPGN